MSEIVLALDPSGNYNEGRGTTGFCMSRDGYIYKAGQIYAAECSSQMEYWTKIINLIRVENKNVVDKNMGDSLTVVCEDYRLYASASEAQINSNLETPQLIGVIKWVCHMNQIPIVMQMAAEVKKRWSNDILIKKKVLSKDSSGKYRVGNIYFNNHSLDALRHCIHYDTFKAKTRNTIKDGPFKPFRKRAYHTETGRYHYYD